MGECRRAGKINVIFNSLPVEIRPDHVLVAVGGTSQILPNDLVWIFAGGTPAYDFLKNIGVGFGMRDPTFDTARDIRR